MSSAAEEQSKGKTPWRQTALPWVRLALLWLGGLALIGWLGWIGYHRWWRPVLLAALAGASLLVGAVIGFVFTSYKDEADTIGKVRDWMVGALAGVTILKFSSLKPVLAGFALGGSPNDVALAEATSVVFVCLGFFLMFFGRKLIINLFLASALTRMANIENMQEASAVTLKLIAAIPSSILAGITDVDQLVNQATQNDKLRTDLNSADVTNFLSQSQKAMDAGASLEWDVVSKVAYLQYYRAYFAADADQTAQRQCAYDWISRALVINPQHVDLAAKRADVLALMQRWAECVSTLRALRERPECPAYVLQWLGFYLLHLPGREQESMDATQLYLNIYPDATPARRNLARAYGQRVCRTAGAQGGAIDQKSDDYVKAIATVRAARQADPDGGKKLMQEDWLKPDGSFSCFVKDDGYLKAVGLAASEGQAG